MDIQNTFSKIKKNLEIIDQPLVLKKGHIAIKSIIESLKINRNEPGTWSSKSQAIIEATLLKLHSYYLERNDLGKYVQVKFFFELIVHQDKMYLNHFRGLIINTSANIMKDNQISYSEFHLLCVSLLGEICNNEVRDLAIMREFSTLNPSKN